MDLSVLPSKTTPFLRDPEFKRKLQELRRGDNTTNWVYLIRTYLMLALVIGATIGFYRFGAAAGWPILWNIPVTPFAIVAVGALQHHLACLAHEAAHNALFKSRYLNDLVGEWLCSFPMISSNFHYGLHHLAPTSLLMIRNGIRTCRNFNKADTS
jgi:fatty acid desaturase